MKIFKYIIGQLILILSLNAYSGEINLTAKFVPSINNSSDDGKFENTTPNSGYCNHWGCDKGKFSIIVPFTANISTNIPAFNQQRDGIYFGLPKTMRTIKVQNTKTGEKIDVLFRVSAISARLNTSSDEKWLAKTGDKTGNSSMMAPTDSGSGCSSGGGLWGSKSWQHFMWNTKYNTRPCYKLSAIERRLPSLIYEISIGYELSSKESMVLVGSGIYLGTTKFTVGKNGDFDLGDNYKPSDSVLNVNLKLTVTHDLKINPVGNQNDVLLQPCERSQICSKEQGEKNWQRWMVSRITPVLTGKNDFLISSSGAFTVYLQCQYSVNGLCAMKSNKKPQLVPLQSYISFPSGIQLQQSSGQVIKYPIPINKDTINGIFLTNQLQTNQKGDFYFEVKKADVDKMLSNRPDTYRGVITAIFDPNIY